MLIEQEHTAENANGARLTLLYASVTRTPCLHVRYLSLITAPSPAPQYWKIIFPCDRSSGQSQGW